MLLIDLSAFLPPEVEEMRRPMCLMIEIPWIVQYQLVPHILTEVDPVEVVVPQPPALGDHEEAEVLIREDHLHTLIQLG